MSESDSPDYAEQLRQISELEKTGVLGPEMMPEAWGNSWPVIKPNELPEWLKRTYIPYGDDPSLYVGEVRYYWGH